MVKSRRLLGLQVIDLDDGRAVGRVNRLIFDPRARRGRARIGASGHWPAEDQVLEWSRAGGVGQHAVTIRGAQALARPGALPELQPLLRRPLRVYGTRVLTEDGEFLGNVEERRSDPRSGEGARVILAPAGLAQRLRGRASIPADAVLVMGEDAMVVRASTVAQPGRAWPDGAQPPGLRIRSPRNGSATPTSAAAPGAPSAGDGEASASADAPDRQTVDSRGRAQRPPSGLVAPLQLAARRGWALLRGRRSPHSSDGGPGGTPASG
ncbi:MAG: hypothetical protein GX496_04025 [Firmicutes bacterium]|nr:hypothetical protein [Bacillota bacterium]